MVFFQDPGLWGLSQVRGRMAGFRFSFWGRGFLSLEAAGFSFAEDILLRGDPYSVLRDLCGGDGVYRGGGL